MLAGDTLLLLGTISLNLENNSLAHISEVVLLRKQVRFPYSYFEIVRCDVTNFLEGSEVPLNPAIEANATVIADFLNQGF